MTGQKKYIGKLTDDAVMSCSRLPALFGASPWSSPNDELRKSLMARGAKFNSDAPIFAGNEAAQHGNNLEGYILLTGAERLGLKIDAEITERVEAFDIPLQGSLDGILYGDGRTVSTDPAQGIYCYNAESVTLDGPGVAEAKLTNDYPSDQPRAYRGPLQCQGLQMCAGFKWHAIFTFFRGTELRIFIGATDEAIQAKIRHDVLDFQSRLDLYHRDGVTDWYPAMNANDASATYGAAEDDLPPITLDGDVNTLAREMIAIKAEIKEKNARIDEIQTVIMDRMGLHDTAFVMDGERAVAELKWGMTPASKEYVVKARPPARAKSLRIKEFRND